MTNAIKPLGPHIDDAAICDVEQRLGCRFPESYRRFLLETNGGEPELNRFEISPDDEAAVNMFYAILGERKDYDLLYEARCLANRLPKGIIAAADASCGNCVCLSTRAGDYGRVYFWDHEMESEEDLSAALTYIAPSFDRFMGSLQPPTPLSELPPVRVLSVWTRPGFDEQMRKLGLLRDPED